MATTTPGKICIRCGQDCSGRPRTRDPQGRYTCRGCYDKLMGAAAAQSGSVTEVKPMRSPAVAGAGARSVAAGVGAGRAAQGGAPQAAALAGAPAEEPIDAGAFLGDALPLEAEPAVLGDVAAAQPKECANCGLFLPRETVICTRCGLNTQTGKVLGTQKLAGEGRQCIKCGYPLQGLKSTKCPECGTVNVVKTREEKRREQDRKSSREVVRNAYLTPIIVFAIGLTASVAMFSALGANAEGALIVFLMRYAIFVPIGVAVYFICCLMWLGFDAPMHLTALRLAAALAITDPIFIPSLLLGFIGIGVMACVLGLALHKLMDLEIQDSIIMAAILILVQRGVVFAIAQAMQEAGA